MLKLIKLFIVTILLLNSLIIIHEAEARKVYFLEKENYYKVSFPAGNFFRAINQYKVSTDVNQVGNKIRWILPTEQVVDNVVCIPSSTIFEGEIHQIIPPQMGQNAIMQLMVHKIIFPNGKEFPISGHLWTRAGDSTIGGEQTKRPVYRRTVHYVERFGSLVQLRPHGARIMGKHTSMKPGTEWVIVLDKKFDLIINK